MRIALLRSISKCTRTFFSPPSIPLHRNPLPTQNLLPPISLSTPSFLRFFSSENENGSSDQNRKPSSDETSLTKAEDASVEAADVDNKELKTRIVKYFDGDDEALPDILEAIMARRLSGKLEDTDDELMEKLQFAPIDDVDDEDFEQDFEEEHETDEEINDLYSARDVVVKRKLEDEYFNMDAKKWDDIVKDATQKGFLRDMRECEEILEDMLHFDKLLPDDIKLKVQKKFDGLGDKCESKELEPEDAYKLFVEFEDQIVKDYLEKLEQERPPQTVEVAEPVQTKRSDDPPGVGPILRWQTRAVFAPADEAWHPKNRKVKLSVKVKELGLTKHQFRRLREIVGKRYHPGIDELTITSERFDHREENRKDCLRTLLNIVEEAGKANAMVEEARTTYVKQRLRANPAFMARLLSKTKQAVGVVSA